MKQRRSPHGDAEVDAVKPGLLDKPLLAVTPDSGFQ